MMKFKEVNHSIPKVDGRGLLKGALLTQMILQLIAL